MKRRRSATEQEIRDALLERAIETIRELLSLTRPEEFRPTPEQVKLRNARAFLEEATRAMPEEPIGHATNGVNRVCS